MAKQSAGILLYRRREALEVFLVHPGGPVWANKDEGAWSIPKGEYAEPEEPLAAACREFEEETGSPIDGDFLPLTPIVQKAGKRVSAWAVEGDIDPDGIVSNTFEIEWPPRSGMWKSFPEVDKAAWFSCPDAMLKINPRQVAFIEELMRLLQESLPVFGGLDVPEER